MKRSSIENLLLSYHIHSRPGVCHEYGAKEKLHINIRYIKRMYCELHRLKHNQQTQFGPKGLKLVLKSLLNRYNELVISGKYTRIRYKTLNEF